jgi:hypothetical protein
VIAVSHPEWYRATLAIVPSLLPGMSAPSPLWTGAVSAAWVGFGFCLARGRRPVYSNGNRFEMIVAGLLGAAVAIVLFFVFGGSFKTLSAGQLALAIVGVLAVMLLGFASGGVAGLFAHAFMNEGRLENPRWHTDTDFLLPFGGEHYCVQGHRGFISHFVSNADQEYAYDWEFPLGTPILCSKEGHITFAKEDEDGSQFMTGNKTANEVHVQHFDGSTAQYLHLRENGVTELNRGLPRTVASGPPMHVYAGQRLAAAGNVGISMFAHLHFTVDRPPGLPEANDVGNRRPVKFQDADTASHGQRCFSMRKYVSSNLDRGKVVVTADRPALNPGGDATDGSDYPRRVPATGGAGVSLPPAPPPVPPTGGPLPPGPAPSPVPPTP